LGARTWAENQTLTGYDFQKPAIEKPIGVAEYDLVRALPKPLDTCLPSIEELETKLSREINELGSP